MTRMYMWMVYMVFFFKHKTSYEMRISDWSSDVCSSDLSASGRSIVDAAALIRYARALGNATAAGALGSWLEREQKRLGVPDRSEERRVGKEGVSPCRSRW